MGAQPGESPKTGGSGQVQTSHGAQIHAKSEGGRLWGGGGGWLAGLWSEQGAKGDGTLRQRLGFGRRKQVPRRLHCPQHPRHTIPCWNLSLSRERKPHGGRSSFRCPRCVPRDETRAWHVDPRMSITLISTGHKLGGLKCHQCIFSHSGGWKSEIEASTGSAPLEALRRQLSHASPVASAGCRKSWAPLEV